MTIRFHQLDLNLLVALDALLAERSITGAARRLNLSQSATSGILSRLREYFGDELLVQVGRRMMPTPLALDLIGRVRHVLQTVNSTIITRDSFDHTRDHRHFKISASDFVNTVLLTEVAQRLQQIAPNITMEVSGIAEDANGQLERGELDFLIMPECYLDQSHPKVSLFESRHTCVVWKGNSLVKDHLTFEQYLNLGHVVIRLNRAPSFEDWFIRQYGHMRRVEVITDNFNTVAQFVVGTRRIATLHERLANFYAKALPLRVLAPPIEIPTLVEGIQWHKYLDGDPGHRWMLDLIRSIAAGDLQSPYAPVIRFAT